MNLNKFKGIVSENNLLTNNNNNIYYNKTYTLQ